MHESTIIINRPGEGWRYIVVQCPGTPEPIGDPFAVQTRSNYKGMSLPSRVVHNWQDSYCPRCQTSISTRVK